MNWTQTGGGGKLRQSCHCNIGVSCLVKTLSSLRNIPWWNLGTSRGTKKHLRSTAARSEKQSGTASRNSVEVFNTKLWLQIGQYTLSLWKRKIFHTKNNHILPDTPNAIRRCAYFNLKKTVGIIILRSRSTKRQIWRRLGPIRWSPNWYGNALIKLTRSARIIWSGYSGL